MVSALVQALSFKREGPEPVAEGSPKRLVFLVIAHSDLMKKLSFPHGTLCLLITKKIEI